MQQENVGTECEDFLLFFGVFLSLCIQIQSEL